MQPAKPENYNDQENYKVQKLDDSKIEAYSHFYAAFCGCARKIMT